MGTTRAYLICTTPRSGSTLLCRYLRASGCAGVPDEYLFESTLPRFYARYGARDFPSYFRALLDGEATPNGVFGLKLMGAPDVFEGYLARLRELPQLAGRRAPWELIGAAFPDVRYVWLTRRDKLRQAISLQRALASGVWQSTEPGAGAPGSASAAAPDLSAIDDCLTDLVAWDAGWEAYFAGAGVRPLTLVYEDVVRDVGAGVGAVLEHLGVSWPAGWSPGAPERERLADDTTERWLGAYRAEAKRARAGARRRAGEVEARRYVRLEGAPASELGARVPGWTLAKALAWKLRPGRRAPPAQSSKSTTTAE